MFDPEIELDPRLAKEFGLKPEASGDPIPFFPKLENDEQELKYITDSFLKIRGAIHNANNRRIDKRALTANPYVLVTLNLDTADRQLWEAGYSLRVRFAFDGSKKDPKEQISAIDMCIKTSLKPGRVVKLFDQTRGEWEARLFTLNPNMRAMIEQNRLKIPPVPEFFKDGHIRDDQFLVESIGATMRNNYPSYEKFERHGKTVLTSFQHTEDWKNIFMTPHADVITTEDNEAEAEFLGFYNLTPDDVDAITYEKLMRKSMKLMDRTILAADLGNIQQNTVTKSARGRNGLESVYGLPTVGLAEQFDMEQRVHEATLFSLSQHVRAKDINLDNIWHHVAGMRGQIERMMRPEEDTFQPAKYAL